MFSFCFSNLGTPQWVDPFSLHLKATIILWVGAGKSGLDFISLCAHHIGRWCLILMVSPLDVLFRGMGGGGDVDWLNDWWLTDQQIFVYCCLIVTGSWNSYISHVYFFSVCHCLLQRGSCDWFYVWSVRYTRSWGPKETLSWFTEGEIYQRNQR